MVPGTMPRPTSPHLALSRVYRCIQRPEQRFRAHLRAESGETWLFLRL
jgi:hypothetical protein